jgi:hypothetical protein
MPPVLLLLMKPSRAYLNRPLLPPLLKSSCPLLAPFLPPSLPHEQL